MDTLFEKYMDIVTEKTIDKTIDKTIKPRELHEDYGGEAVERIITTIAPQFFFNGNAAINNGNPYLRYSYHYDKELSKICKKAKSPEDLKNIIIKYIQKKGQTYQNITLRDLKWVKPGGWNHIYTEIKEDYGDTPLITKKQEDEYLDNYYKRFIKK